jgi:hypothetical protein
LLRTLGITPAKEGSRQASEQTKHDLAAIRAAFEQGLRQPELSHVESP